MFSWPPGVARKGSELSPAEIVKKTRKRAEGPRWEACCSQDMVGGCVLRKKRLWRRMGPDVGGSSSGSQIIWQCDSIISQPVFMM